MHKQNIQDFLTKYMNIPSPGGYTHKALLECQKDFESLGLSTFFSKKGALIATFPGKNSAKEVVVSAHIDTLGGMVKEILPSGLIRFHKIGGGVYDCLEGENCTILTATGKSFRGSILPLKSSTHIYGADGVSGKRDEYNMVIRLDEKISSAQDVYNLGINVGDFINMDTRLEFTPNGFIKSRYLDNKACLAVVLDICKRWVENNITPAYTTLFYISNFEEMGHGVSNIFSSNVEEFVALDIGIVGEGQQSSEYKVSITAKDAKTVYDFSLRQKLVNLCLAEDIDYAVDVYNRYSSDATQAIVSFGCDFKFACIGPGVDASHHYERTHIDSLINTSKLVEAYLLSN